jgi:peptidoglycan/xylan/chitin deacetylase (PgdA/CDA1 family)
MAPTRRAFLATAAATLAAACTDHATAPSTVPPPSAPSTTLAPAERGSAGAAPTTTTDARPARVVFAGPRTRRQVALTFHLSGDPGLVARLLEVAAHASVPISLFAVGRWLTEHPTLAQRILADGHELDNHTWSHPMLGRLDPPAVAAEIHRCQAALTQTTGSGGRYFRPSGMTNPTPLVLTQAAAAGYPLVVAFDIDPRDYTDPGPDAVAARVAAGLRPGSIVSLHTGHPDTITALAPILAAAHARRLQPVLLHQLLEHTPSGP